MSLSGCSSHDMLAQLISWDPCSSVYSSLETTWASEVRTQINCPVGWQQHWKVQRFVQFLMRRDTEDFEVACGDSIENEVQVLQEQAGCHVLSKHQVTRGLTLLWTILICNQPSGSRGDKKRKYLSIQLYVVLFISDISIWDWSKCSGTLLSTVLRSRGSSSPQLAPSSLWPPTSWLALSISAEKLLWMGLGLKVGGIDK